ncbi:hypothetical protein OG562_15555 [Streptomyces sp. NBC_01275]|uniref:hypothetical protein n=1 Tax=Streptomyces sp. NBC_01275 TaxID=2903807 RepID=UPI002250AFE9|nr:hypothetical protein [Streptomyces sp. NBC_01275]MCX4762367.1 hypothetical protein [Streptomyces sp. NBC_01275]
MGVPSVPSDEEILQAVERFLSRRGVPVSRLADPGAAAVSWQSVLECRIVRSIERREERRIRVEGRRSGKRGVASGPTYTDLATHSVAPPADPATPHQVTLLREGSLTETECGDCAAGKQDCERCDGRGGHTCRRHVECDVCHGGPDACWECDGTGHPRTHRVRRTAPRPEDARERAECRRCKRPEVACPKCLGERQLPCPTCAGSGRVTCDACRGAKRLRHGECAGTGWFTEWTQGVVTHTPHTDELRTAAYPFLTRLRKGQWHYATLTAATDDLPDFLEDAHRKQLTPVLAVKKQEVRRRVDLRYLPVARVVITGEPDSVYYAYPGHTAVKVLHRPSKDRVTALAWCVAAVIALVAVLWLTVWR